MDASRSGPLLRLEQVSKIYPTGEVLRNVTWEVKPGDRIGLVGVNGAGKSTQMRLIAGFEEPSSGQVVRQGSPRIAYLQQEFDVDLERSVREELFQAFGEAATVLNRQREVEEEMGSEKAAEDPDHLDELIHELGRLQSRFEGLHGYELDARIDKLLPTIGFSAAGAERPVKDYSGGCRCALPWEKFSCKTLTYCSLMNPPTIWMWRPFNGSRDICWSRALPLS